MIWLIGAEARGHMHKLRMRLTIWLIVILAFAMILTGVFVARILVNSNNDVLKLALEREIEIILSSRAWSTSENLDQILDYYANQVKNKNEIIKSRLTFIDSSGKVIVDSDYDPSSMENHLDRPEIRQALIEGIGYDQRFSDTLKQKMLYVSMPVRENEQLVGFLRASISLQQIDEALYKLWFNMFVGLFVLFVISAYISYRIARNITKPIEQITEVAKHISNMNYTERIDVTGKDEVAQLAREVNAMADNLLNQMNVITESEARLKNIVANMISGLMLIDRDQKFVFVNPAAENMIGYTSIELVGRTYIQSKQQFEFMQLIEKAMISQERIREELLFFYPVERVVDVHLIPIFHTNEMWSGLLIVLHDITALRKLEQMRSEFVANVSHELKTPLAAVKGFSETLLAGALDDRETARSFIQIIYDESERLNRLITDTLDLSKIESKRIPLRFSAIHLSRFTANIIQVMSTEAQKKQIHLQMDVDQSLYLEADEDCLRQIMINVISNGISYTPEHGKVMVRIEVKQEGNEDKSDFIHIRVIDTGIGIPKQDLPRIFERFYRVDKARSRISGGTGLGLSIVKHLVELHNGSIRVESKHGLGTEFIITLPVLHEN
jgi:two-component system phosphate regulon sensor histidine kinase PhoR